MNSTFHNPHTETKANNYVSVNDTRLMSTKATENSEFMHYIKELTLICVTTVKTTETISNVNSQQLTHSSYLLYSPPEPPVQRHEHLQSVHSQHRTWRVTGRWGCDRSSAADESLSDNWTQNIEHIIQTVQEEFRRVTMCLFCIVAVYWLQPLHQMH